MALRTWQKPLALNTMYDCRKSSKGADSIQPAIEVVGGTVAIYGSFAADAPPAPPAGMSQTATGFSGIDSFKVMPNWLYITGTASSIIISGVDAKPTV